MLGSLQCYKNPIILAKKVLENFGTDIMKEARKVLVLDEKTFLTNVQHFYYRF